MSKTMMGAAAGCVAGAMAIAPVWGEKAAKPAAPDTKEAEAKEAESTAEEEPAAKKVLPPPKPISEQITKGLAYLAKIQNTDGGWGQGGGWRQNTEAGGRVKAGQAEDRSDLGNTCYAMLALLRSGAEVRSGPYAENLRKGADYVMKQVEESDDTSLYVTSVRDTQLQSKIGRYVDTFLAMQLLSELKDLMPDPDGEIRRARMLDKVVAKVGANQQDNGAFANNAGWASVLSQGICSRSLNYARLVGAKVTDEMLERDNKQNLAGLDVAGKKFAVAGGGAAGIALYDNAAKVRGFLANAAVNQQRQQDFQSVVKSPTAEPAEKAKAEEELRKIADNEVAKDAALEAVVANVKDDNFVKGFGNNGGEEFLSYMNISESMRLEGGENWTDWDEKITATINNAQNDDGSWSGHHCITGRTFCTAGALLTLMADRAPVTEPKEDLAAADTTPQPEEKKSVTVTD